MRMYRFAAATLAAMAMVATACGSGSSSSSPTTAAPTTTVAPTTTTLDAVAAKAAVTATWVAFFDGKNTDNAAKLKLLENGDKLADTFRRSAAKSAGLAAQTSVQVNSVEIVSTSDCNDALGESVTCAKVGYDLLLNGKPALQNQIGYAVFINGEWKVSQVTECALSHLGGVDCPA